MKINKVLFIIMGGTIDAHWDGKLDTAVPNITSIIPEYFKQFVLYLDVSFETVCLKDSRQIGSEELKKLKNIIEQTEFEKIIITHGTYAMPDTAKFVKYNVNCAEKTIIFTGSMVPLMGFSAESSDATFNIGFAVARIQQEKQGVYLAMNGCLFDPDEVAKNLLEGKFYSVFDLKQ